MGKFKSYFGKLKDKYRLLIINESSFEEKFAFRLSRMNVIMLGATFSVFLAFLILLAIIYTPLKTMIPGYSDAETRKNMRVAAESSKEIEGKLNTNEAYLFNLKKVLSGEIDVDSLEVIQEQAMSYDNLDYSISSEDSLLRKEIEDSEKYSLDLDKSSQPGANRDLSDLNFFCPLRGDVSSEYQLGVNHLGVDIVAPAKETIKSILDGVVILSTWSSDEGHIIAIQHNNEVVSIYKHNSVLLKKIGDVVKVGESIAIIGNSGELTDGPHLHFELWHDGIALNPSDYILFN
ncbi:MAG: murein DD-endopeptidase MepM/ murein hydrolase activator NlpD [Patiriisocius sp.]|jgi:murein DD-endopeptidase MepM/ murein hydrolase activator NlpD